MGKARTGDYVVYQTSAPAGRERSESLFPTTTCPTPDCSLQCRLGGGGRFTVGAVVRLRDVGSEAAVVFPPPPSADPKRRGVLPYNILY